MKLLAIFLVYAVALSIALRRAGFRPAGGTATATPAQTPRRIPARILIIGATGGTGRALVTAALERGLVVTALARNPKDLAIEHPNLRIVAGNVLDYASIDAAVQGQDAVLSALGHRRYLGPSRILSEGTSNLLRAMEAHHVSRFVCETSLGIGDTAGRLGLYYTLFVIPVVLPFYFWDKTRQERLIAESGLDWVIVRPGALTNGAKRGNLRHGAQVGNFLWTVRVARTDVAEFMLNQLTDDAYLRAAPGVSRLRAPDDSGSACRRSGLSTPVEGRMNGRHDPACYRRRHPGACRVDRSLGPRLERRLLHASPDGSRDPLRLRR